MNERLQTIDPTLHTTIGETIERGSSDEALNLLRTVDFTDPSQFQSQQMLYDFILLMLQTQDDAPEEALSIIKELTDCWDIDDCSEDLTFARLQLRDQIVEPMVISAVEQNNFLVAEGALDYMSDSYAANDSEGLGILSSQFRTEDKARIACLNALVFRRWGNATSLDEIIELVDDKTDISVRERIANWINDAKTDSTDEALLYKINSTIIELLSLQ